ncbi:MAG: GNAT family N-acetyltransferase [Terriglobales bacterium]|jgi:hypothetical protein
MGVTSQHKSTANGALVITGDVSECGCANQDHGKSSTSTYDPLAPTIFHEEWWLNAATGGTFEVAEVTAGGRTLGRFPFYIRKRLGLRLMHMPELTYFLGPAIAEGEGSPSNRFLKRLEITRELIDKLPAVSSRYVKCHTGITDAIAFQERSFRAYVQFTHEISPRPVETLWQEMRDKTRNVVRRAREQLFIRELADPAEFFELFERNLALENLRNGLDTGLCQNIIGVALDRQRGRILAAYDKNKRMVAANVCVWDETRSYYLLSTRCSDSGNGASSLLIWEALQESARRGLMFDFAGLGARGSILLYTGFGGVVSPRYVAVHMNPFARIAIGAKSLFVRENFFY